MADNSLMFPDDPNFVLQNSDASALLNSTRQQMSSQYPILAQNPTFQRSLNDAFNSFVNQSTQRGTDYNDVWAKTVQPVISQWTTKAGQDTTKLEGDQEMAGLEIAKHTGSPQAAVQVYPQLIAPNSKYRSDWMKRIGKADEAPSLVAQKDKIKLSAFGTALTQAIKDKDTDAQASIVQQIDQLQPTLTPQGPMLVPSQPAAGPPPAAAGAGVAAPMGTSGTVGSNPNKPQIFIGDPNAQQAAQLAAAWAARQQPQQPPAAGPPSQGAPAPPQASGPSLTPTTGQMQIPAATLDQIQGGQPAAQPPAPSGPQITQLTGPPQGGQSPFNSPDMVQAAYKAGRITQEQAVQILQQQFGMQ